jgi:hypothetical protein
MDDKIFYRILLVITAIGVASFVVIAVWTWFLYKDCSIISYIANKG